MLSFKLLPFDFSLKETLILKPLQIYLRQYYVCLRNRFFSNLYVKCHLIYT